MDLPVVNLRLALTDPNLSQHAAARHYWDGLRADSIGFSRFPRLNFLHLQL